MKSMLALIILHTACFCHLHAHGSRQTYNVNHDWRTRSYPIVISANDSVLYRGVTSPILGFFYIEPEEPVQTDNLKVRLFGQTEFNDVYKLVEITGKLDKETADDMAVKKASNLNIVEIEVFEHL